MSKIDPNSPSDAELANALIDEEQQADDQIIGRAFKLSITVAIALAVLAGVVWLVANQAPEPEVVEEAAAPTVQTLAEADEFEPPAIRFTDITETAGIDFTHSNGAYGERLLPETMGGGVAFFDYDNDGDQDLLLIDSGQWPWRDGDQGEAVLYQNDGSGQFQRVENSGLSNLDMYATGVAVADIDGDGFRDVFISAVGENRMLRNIDGSHFEDITEAMGLAGSDQAWSTSSIFFDADNDGDLDLFVCNYVEWSPEIDRAVDFRLTGIGRAYGPPTDYAGTFSYLFRNDGDRFTDVSAESGVQVSNPATGLPAGKSLAVLALDVDSDGWTDLVVANDTVRNFFFRNLGDGQFEEVGMASGLAFDNTGNATGAMGMDAATFDQSNELAIAVGNFANEMTSFYVSPRQRTMFSDRAVVSGIGPGSRQALSFGLFFFDVDLDGHLDLLQTNGHVEDEINVVQPSQNYQQPTQLFYNCAGRCARQFAQVPLQATGDLARPVVGRGASYADIDGDGDLDVLITQVNRRPLLLRNEQQSTHHWLRVEVEGTAPNRDAIGATVVLQAGEHKQVRTVAPTRSYQSQVELPITFGLGPRGAAVNLTITWPDGRSTQLTDIEVDQQLRVPYPN